jgi:serine/threonine protein phosphatase PrpC
VAHQLNHDSSFIRRKLRAQTRTIKIHRFLLLEWKKSKALQSMVVDRILLMLLLRTLCHNVRVRASAALQHHHQQQQPLTTSRRTAGISLTPCDVLWDSTARTALQLLRQQRSKRTTQTTATEEDAEPFVTTALYPCCHDDGKDHRFLTLTLVGDKGGKNALDQINQDRAFIHHRGGEGGSSSANNDPDILLAGVVDGHGASGHYVAEWIRHSLKQQLFVEPLGSNNTNNNNNIPDFIAHTVKSLDKTVPPRFAYDSGATLSFLLRVGETLYFSNTGDSQTFLAAAVLDERNNDLLDVNIVFASELHKPTARHERQRLEALGHTIDADEDRVWYAVPNQGLHGMATSRTIGDHQAGPDTLIPDPDVVQLTIHDVLKNQRMKRQLLSSPNSTIASPAADQEVCTGDVQSDGSVDTASCHDVSPPPGERIHLFVVSATDGILDYFKPEEMAYQVRLSL